MYCLVDFDFVLEKFRMINHYGWVQETKGPLANSVVSFGLKYVTTRRECSANITQRR
jgi:hypothetical protein